MMSQSIFSGIVVHENAYTVLLCNLMKRHRVFMAAMMTRLLSAEAAQIIEPEWIQTERTIRRKISDGRPDIFIESPNIVAIIEVKTSLTRGIETNQGTPEEGENARGYLEYLKSRRVAALVCLFGSQCLEWEKKPRSILTKCRSRRRNIFQSRDLGTDLVGDRRTHGDRPPHR